MVLAVVAVVVPSGPAPAQPLTWSGTTLGGPWKTGAARVTTAPLALANLGTGTYKVTVTETVNSATGRPSRLSVVTTPVQHVLVSNWFNLGHPTTMASMVVGVRATRRGPRARRDARAAAHDVHPPNHVRVLHLRRIGLLHQCRRQSPQHSGRHLRAVGEDRELTRSAGRAVGPQVPAIPTMGWFRCWPPIDPRNVAMPKENRPPSEATSW